MQRDLFACSDMVGVLDACARFGLPHVRRVHRYACLHYAPIYANIYPCHPMLVDSRSIATVNANIQKQTLTQLDPMG